MLHGRSAETARIDQLLADARAGVSGALVVRGPAGIGKTSLADHAVAAATGMRVLRGTGIESESELAFAALQLLLRNGIDRLDRLPGPQADALSGAFGLTGGQPADRFLVGLAALSLLSELAGDGALLCVVDDAQWLDQPSADALVFAARRLGSEGIALLFTARDEGFPAPGLAELRLTGLDPASARALVDEHSPGLSPVLVDRVLAEAAGNPLALRELPGAARDTPVLTPLPLPERIQRSYYRQVVGLPAAARTFLLVAAAEETGDLGVILRATEALGATADAIDPAERSGLVMVRLLTVTFRHPLVRAAIYQGATFAERAAAHTALAGVLTGEARADRRAWHLAAAATGPDEAVATELEHTADRARQRLGYATAATALAHAARLTEDHAARARRLASAASSAVDGGRADAAVALAEQAAALTDDPLTVADLARVRAWVAAESGAVRAAHEILLPHGDAVAELAPATAAAMFTDAIRAGWWLGDAGLVRAAVDRLTAVARRHPTQVDTPVPWIEAMAELVAGQAERAMPPLRQAVSAALRQPPADLEASLYMADVAVLAGDFAASHTLSRHAADEVRTRGVIRSLARVHLNLAFAEFQLNRFPAAAADATEGLRLAEDTSQPLRVAGLRAVLALLAAVEGDETRCRELAAGCVDLLGSEQNACLSTLADWALALLELGQGRFDAALARFTATERQQHVFATFVAPDQVEAAVRDGRPELARRPLARFAAWTEASGQAWAVAALHRCQALVAEDAEEHFIAALSGHDRPFDKARTALLYGEWLRRNRRVAEARGQLRNALAAFERAGAVPWAERTRAELRAAGEAPSTPAADTLRLLTPQELQVVRLAAAGATNRDIAARLFLSPRTVSHHLYRAFPKLGVTTRTALARLDLGDPT